MKSFTFSLEKVKLIERQFRVRFNGDQPKVCRWGRTQSPQLYGDKLALHRTTP